MRGWTGRVHTTKKAICVKCEKVNHNSNSTRRNKIRSWSLLFFFEQPNFCSYQINKENIPWVLFKIVFQKMQKPFEITSNIILLHKFWYSKTLSFYLKLSRYIFDWCWRKMKPNLPLSNVTFLCEFGFYPMSSKQCSQRNFKVNFCVTEMVSAAKKDR